MLQTYRPFYQLYLFKCLLKPIRSDTPINVMIASHYIYCIFQMWLKQVALHRIKSLYPAWFTIYTLFILLGCFLWTLYKWTVWKFKPLGYREEERRCKNHVIRPNGAHGCTKHKPGLDQNTSNYSYHLPLLLYLLSLHVVKTLSSV